MGQNGQDHFAKAQHSGPCCVLWTPAGQEPPRELLASLERRGLAWVAAQDGYSAMAEILLRQRASNGTKSAVLVLVHPTKLDLSGIVVDALGRFAGPVAVWRYDPEAHPVLAAAQRHELATVFVRTESIEPRPVRAPEPKPKPPSPKEEEDEPTASSLLSDDELSMLLAERPER
ncbi:MAG: hypothetical protein NCW75_00850 [Phycisphaera sp.]|nr:MAG: hypothetical protein NCW75_00850 [Phycisphaera sp.]